MGRILGPDGKAMTSDEVGRFPAVHRQPPVLLTGRFTEKQQFEAVLEYHKQGYFQYSTWLVEQMMTADRVASAMQTRCDKLTGTPVSFVPVSNSDEAQRAARDLQEDDSLIAPATVRAQMLLDSLMQGFKLAQKHWYVDPSTGRAIPQLEPWNNAFVQWDASAWAYRVWTWQEGWKLVQSPSLTVPGEPWKPPAPAVASPLLELDDPRLWIVAEPFGVHSWRYPMALIYSLWESYFGYALANNDMNAVCEQQGRGQRTLEYPKVSDNERAKQEEYISKLVDMGSNSVIPLEQQGTNIEGETVGYKLKPFEYPSNGWNIVVGTKESNASSITIRILGHNTQGETKGSAGAGGGAATGTMVRGDIGIADTLREFRWRYRLYREWAAVNYGDPNLAPFPFYDTTEPAQNVAAGQTAQFISAALDELDRFGVDTTEYLRRARFPIRKEAQAPGWRPLPPAEGAKPKALPPVPDDKKEEAA